MGGSSGGGRRFSVSDLAELSRTAKDALKSAAEPERRCVFISFATEDLDEVNLLRGQAKNESSGFDLIDRSLHEPFDSQRAEYIKQGIRARINQSSVTLVYLSPATANSQWVDWEIRESIKLGRGVIAVYQGDTRPATVPPALSEIRAQVVPWKHEQIASAIERANQQRVKSQEIDPKANTK